MKIYPQQFNPVFEHKTDTRYPLYACIWELFTGSYDENDDEDLVIQARDQVILTAEAIPDEGEEVHNLWKVHIEHEYYTPGPYAGTCHPAHRYRELTNVTFSEICELFGTSSAIFSRRYNKPIRAQLVLEFDQVERK